MDYEQAMGMGNDTVVRRVRHFDLEQTLDCGQCFRWRKNADGSYSGVALGRELTVGQRGGDLIFHDTAPGDFRRLWRPYFDLDRDYGAVKRALCSDPVMRRAVDFCPGMRVARQEPWEALCTFIISQNNNIPRIKGIVQRLCEGFGRLLPGGGFAFPGPERLAGLQPQDLADIRSGFRARYILDAARLVHAGELELDTLYTLELARARESLMRVKGVGPKVAECALLYGLGRAECFPVDVWIARALEQLYPGGFPAAFAPVAGIAQQYLFHYIRHHPGDSGNSKE